MVIVLSFSDTQTICSGLAKYVQDHGVPEEPLHLDLDSFAAHDIIKSSKLEVGNCKRRVASVVPPPPAPVVAPPSASEHPEGYAEERASSSTVIHRHIWSKAHTMKMLDLYRAFENSMDSRKKKYPIWQLIATDLNKEFSLDLNADQCNQRFKNLKMKCRREWEDRERRSRSDATVGPATTYHQAMCLILGHELTPSSTGKEPEKILKNLEVASAVLNAERLSDIESLTEMLPDERDSFSGISLWNTDEQMRLLCLVKRCKDQFCKLRNQLPLWNVIAKDLNQEFGSNKHGEQCRVKYKNMKKKFMKNWRAREAKQEMGEPLKTPDMEYEAMFDLCSREITITPQEMKDSIDSATGDMVVQTLSIIKSESGEEKPVKLALTKRTIVDHSPGPRSKREKLQTIQKVQDIIMQSDVRLNETLLQLHAENKKIMEKLIDKL
jgi:hypothetical protein